MTFGRKHFIAGTATAYATIGILRLPAGAAEFTYTYANDWPPSHPFTVRMVQAAGKILQESNGRLQIRVFPSGVLGTGAGMLTQIRTGAIEFLDGGFNDLQSLVPIVGLTGLPFVFAGQKEATDAADGPLGKLLRAALAKINMYAFERSWDGGFRQIESNVKPIRVPDDMKGLRIRTPTTPTAVTTFRALGASPVAIDGTMMYTAAQTHVVDAADLPLNSVDTFKMYEVMKYASIVNWAWTGAFMIANAAAWQKLPADLREIVARNFDAGALAERADMLRLDTTVRGSLQGRGMLINQAEIPQFKAKIKAAGLYGQWRTQYGADAFQLLEQAVGDLT